LLRRQKRAGIFEQDPFIDDQGDPVPA
jgi:hypothetical protein